MPFWAAAAWSRTARYQQHFARPILHEQDLQHEELLAGYPERWGNLVRDICLSEGGPENKTINYKKRRAWRLVWAEKLFFIIS